MTIGDPSLHTDDPVQHLTLPGQAHFADPSMGANCGECRYFVPKPFVQIKRHCCSKAKLMTGKWLKPIPATAMACKYFERRT